MGDNHMGGNGNAMSTEKTDGMLKLGLIGTVVTALCCFTPLLVVLLGTVGLSAVLGYLDLVLFPALAVFVALMAYALWRKHHRASNS